MKLDASAPAASKLMRAILRVNASLDLQGVLTQYVDHARALTGATCGVLTVLDNRGQSARIVHSGAHPELADSIQALPAEADLQALLGTGTWSGIKNVACHALRIHEQVYGRLYLFDAPQGFSAESTQLVEALSAVTAVAVENSKLYADARNRERWIRVSQQLTTTLLEGTDEEEALELITRSVREVADADTAIIVLPSVKDTWAAEIVEGYGAAKLIGVRFPPQGRAMTVLREGQGMIVDSLQRAATLRVAELAKFGPALYAPLIARRKSAGVLILLRLPGKREFEPGELALAESVASQAALALELASARHAEDMANLLEERARIGRDLHDLAIQQLFATGMQLDAVRSRINTADEAAAYLSEAIETALHAVDDSVKQIRAIVHDLRERDENVAVVERLRRETSLARNALGFAPSYVLQIDGENVGGTSVEDEARSAAALAQIEDRISADLADDVVAVVREGLSNVARHARASSVSVTVALAGAGKDGQILVTVSDDGQGLDPEQHRRSGLDNLTSRARRHGGSFWIGMNPSGRGTLMEWTARLAL